MLSQTAEYALRAMVFLAGHPDRYLTTPEVAAATQVPAGYLAKVLQSLGRAGLVSAQRGLRGGYRLARPPEKITILAVVNAVDPIVRIHECPLSLESHSQRLCPLHRRLDDAYAQVEAAFGASNLAELVVEPGEPVPLQDRICLALAPDLDDED